MVIPMARKHAATSKGATGPRDRLSTSTFPNNPVRIATRPLPRKIAFENVIDNHCCLKPLCRKEREWSKKHVIIFKSINK